MTTSHFTEPTLVVGASESIASSRREACRMFVPGPVPVASHLLAITNQQLPYNHQSN